MAGIKRESKFGRLLAAKYRVGEFQFYCCQSKLNRSAHHMPYHLHHTTKEVTSLCNTSTMFPPSPESPAVRFTRGGAASATPRVGMLVSNAANNQDADDVSVLTFHTCVTKDTSPSPFDGSHRSDDHKDYSVVDEGIKKSLSHISEESHNSGEGYKAKTHEGAQAQDDESLSLAESVLDSTNKLLSSIGSSSYYPGLSTKLSIKEKQAHAQETFSPPPKPNAKHPSPVKLESFTQKSLTSLLPEKSTEKKKCSYDRYSSGENDKRNAAAAHQKQSSYMYDEPSENTNKSNYQEEKFNEKYKSNSGKDRLSKLEAETKQLQRLLREKQLETKLAMSELDASIQRANALLK
jgi:hypothetical protein